MSDPLKDVIAEMRDGAAGLRQSPILAIHGYAAAIDVWADRLAALASSLSQETDEQQKEDTRVGSSSFASSPLGNDRDEQRS